ncbi:universal stress protein [Shewanella canadensis]|uniref:Universal stress protein n=1 Tax=Shewanella canadensis TaxID=271096 RepID=A0A3S0LM66_9GAMM|nr:universal stress protein [Shewanella canadensis]RTR38712.1 universal stress protein [Shewanella canadensis]
MNKCLYLVGVDGSEWGDRATERAVHLAKQTGAQVKLVYVLSWPAVQPMMVEEVAPPTILDRDEEEKQVTKNVLEPLKRKYSGADVPITTELVWGDPALVLHDCAKEERANMLFVGRRGRSRFADLILGSVANKLAHCIGIPLVLVP